MGLLSLTFRVNHFVVSSSPFPPQEQALFHTKHQNTVTDSGVLQAWRQLAGDQALTAYLFTALRRAAARCAARRARRPTLSETAVDEAAAPAGEMDDLASPYSDRLQRALLALPAEQREAIALKIDGELTFAQIAQVIGVSINAPASRYRYALDKLRTSLGGWPESRNERSPPPPGEN